ncbi:hypothetical protein BDK51DRAFT_41999 [Blyttiomyces helicus]|uniref:Uncharacterized protein n=1 Tax=Blyttiomyces helicus TaxID=388810 RepID=A0A4P9WQL3_9FUNG|nr:hypothetical protein BDK51DRAFT_41999 [Blyttiomyces helicus]|eukprot:RKO93166.1 hypothetical protein BDK51DRAFT_41999 [Blyttiomyces helicus]
MDSKTTEGGSTADIRTKQVTEAMKSRIETAEQLRQQPPPPPAPESIGEPPSQSPQPLKEPYPQPPPEMQRTRPPARMWRVPTPAGSSTPAPGAMTPTPTSAPPLRSWKHMPTSDPNLFVDLPPPASRDEAYLMEEGRSDDCSIPFFGTGITREPPDDPEPAPEPPKRTGSLLDGEFDERASHKEFVLALQEWRNAGKVEAAGGGAGTEVGTGTESSATLGPDRGSGRDSTRQARPAWRSSRDAHDEPLLPTHAAPSSTGSSTPSLASIGRSISSFGASLGAALGMAVTALAPAADSSGGGGTSSARPSFSAGSKPGDRSLLEGTYDESGSHRSFLSALNDWRGVRQGDAGYTGQPPSLPSSSEWDLPPAAPESASLTYMERLLLHKFRRRDAAEPEERTAPFRPAPAKPNSDKEAKEDLECGSSTAWDDADDEFLATIPVTAPTTGRDDGARTSWVRPKGGATSMVEDITGV